MLDQPEQVESFQTRIIDPSLVRFEYEGENLTFNDSDGIFYPRVSLRRCFPLSSENTNIIVRIQEECVEKTVEIGMIEDVCELEECSQEAVLRELHLHYVVPMVLRINNIKEEFGFLYWTVETDRGHKEFIMRDSIVSSTRQVSKGRWLIIDINQTRYEIHNIEALDTQSQNLLRRYLLL
jgi:hypothetical protein